MNVHIRVATLLAKLMDEQFRIGKVKFGLDPIVGAIPWFGDLLSLILSLYIFAIAYSLNLPKDKMGKMLSNLILDFLIGLIPLLGDLSDVFYKANSRNLKILHEHVGITVVEGELVESNKNASSK